MARRLPFEQTNRAMVLVVPVRLGFPFRCVGCALLHPTAVSDREKPQPTPGGFSRQGRNPAREGVGTLAGGDKRPHAAKRAVYAAPR